MRKLVKGDEPAILADVRQSCANDKIGNFYDNCLLPGWKDVIRQALWQAQHGYCAYTGLRIRRSEKGVDPKSSVIEHIYPRNPDKSDPYFRKHPYGQLPQCDVRWENLLLCVKVEAKYGEKTKENKCPPPDFLHPFSDLFSEEIFVFHEDGRITPEKEANEAATKTIEILNLNHKELVGKRLALYSQLNLVVDPNEVLDDLADIDDSVFDFDQLILDAKRHAFEFSFAVEQIAKRKKAG
ncbi:MAG: hypothetical protein SF002_06100 [Alphaproteobacteria bacterium]|nr:hypothetical protein [Alphaproteobacteria bacterium]